MVNYGNSQPVTTTVDYGNSQPEGKSFSGFIDYTADGFSGVGNAIQHGINWVSDEAVEAGKYLGFIDEDYVNTHKITVKPPESQGEALGEEMAGWFIPVGAGFKAVSAGTKGAVKLVKGFKGFKGSKGANVLGKIPKTGFGPADKLFDFAMKGKVYTKGDTVKGVFNDLKSGIGKVLKGTVSLAAGKATGGLMIGDAIFFITKTIPARTLGAMILKMLGKAPSRAAMRRATNEAKKFQNELAKSVPASKPHIKLKPTNKNQGGIMRRNTGGAIGKGIMRPRYRANKVL